MEFTAGQRKAVLDLARATILARLRFGSGFSAAGAPGPATPAAPADDPALRQPAGCFVTLHALQTHRLRGCVGRLEATDPLAEAVRSAAQSVLEDPRFYDDPVRLEELPELELEVSVLSPLRPAAGPTEFDLLEDGLLLTCGRRSGCFLPQVARETGWGKEQLLDRLCTEKMGLPPGAWRGLDARLSLFSTVTIGPEPFVPAGSSIT